MNSLKVRVDNWFYYVENHDQWRTIRVNLRCDTQGGWRDVYPGQQTACPIGAHPQLVGCQFAPNQPR